ncbi:MAG: transketolase, partial [Deltaproteobacteria bacterium]|nr:transketolase [Deltaproteobacteria bacterium]
MGSDETDIAARCINSIRTLAIDAVEKAKSGHPGAPMGMAPIGYTLWTRFLRHNPANPSWRGRDRFVLSAGHASMLVYSLLYLTGYDVGLEDLMRFRQLGSSTPGHPELGATPGVELTTGPLGQGISSAVGIDLARLLLGARFNRPGFDLTDYFVYVLLSDGDVMEGVSSEASSLAGHLGLGSLICLYDDNKITIEGCTDLAFSEDVCARYEAYGWHVSSVDDANDVESLSSAIEEARAVEDRPSLIAVRSRIACGSPNLEGSEASHGAPLGSEETRLTKRNLDWPEDEEFHVPGDVLGHMREAVERGAGLEAGWDAMLAEYRREFPSEAAEYDRVMEGRLPGGWEDSLPAFEPGTKVATRSASGKVLAALAPVVPELVGGSADLGPSNNTFLKEYPSVCREDFSGRNLHFGVREHGMAAVMNGMARHGGFIPYGGTFLVFSDYMRPAVRLAAMMGLHVVYVFTHDSLGVGEDGPTHQPVEQLAALRAVPGLTVLRPADAAETVEAWRVALEGRGPSALVLSRQALPVLDRERLAPAEGLRRGAYVLTEPGSPPDIAIIATGSEVELALMAAGELDERSVAARVISMPSWELFEEQEPEYRSEVLPDGLSARLAVEAGISQGWARYVGLSGATISVERFGTSAPGGEALEQYGFSVENVVRAALDVLS